MIDKNSIQCNDVVKIYTDSPISVTALRGINYKFESGIIYVIFGPSGSGKTTLLSILGGLEIPSSGSINFNNAITINNKSNDLFNFRINTVSFIFQEPIFIPFLRVTENIKFTAKKKQKDLDEKVNEILNTTKLIHRKESYPF